MLELWRTESVNVDVRIFFPDVLQKIDIPFERQFWMMSALHENLNTARRGKFVKFLIELLTRENVMVFITLSPIKRAELAINIANIRVIDVSIGDVGHDLAAATAVGLFFCAVSSCIRHRAQF